MPHRLSGLLLPDRLYPLRDHAEFLSAGHVEGDELLPGAQDFVDEITESLWLAFHNVRVYTYAVIPLHFHLRDQPAPL